MSSPDRDHPDRSTGTRRVPARSGVVRALAVLAMLVLASQSAWARPKQNPPSLSLRKPPNTIVAATLERVDGHHLTVHVTETLYGPEPDGVLTVQVPDWALAGLETGRDYLLTYNDSRRDPMRPRKQMAQPGGPRLVHEPGAEPALFPASPELRDLLASDTACILGLDRQGRQRLFDGLASPQPALQQFLAVDLFMCPDVRASLSGEERAIIERRIADAGSHPLARAWLLRLVLEDDQRFDGRGAVLAEAILSQSPLAIGGGQHAELVRATLAQLELAGIAARPATLARWLRSDAPVLAELALLALRRQDPGLERSALAAALAEPDLPASTRHFLLDHDRRLALARGG
jgi:hypothetical protein